MKILLNKITLFLIASLLSLSIGNYAAAQIDVSINTTKIIDPVVIFETELGKIVIEFFPNDAPKHVENFIKLSQSGFYDGVLFHRIIPGFMIQGGDPNTINGDPSTWGIGGPDERVDAEFNTIKHNRGIVSMARSADPNSGGSQFFIVHKDSNFLDEQYTVFGRIVTEESFETLDKIASVETKSNDQPIDAEQVRITKVTIFSRSEVPDILELPEPERTLTISTEPSGSQKFESSELNVSFNTPAGWLLQQPEKAIENSPDVVAVGPKVGKMNPVISLTAQQTNQRTLDELINEKLASLKEVVDSGNLNIILQKKTTINGNQAYEINAEGYFSSNGENFNVKFREIMIYDEEKFYTLSYSNDLANYNSQLPRFEETVDSFTILSKDNSDNESNAGGGCLIATATFGSELVPQVQFLREIRDNQLMNTVSGVSFMTGFNQLYYSFSPYIADLERENLVFKEMVKIGITPMLSTLSIMSLAESESEVLGYGIGVIMLNVGMYFVAPIVVIYRIRK